MGLSTSYQVFQKPNYTLNVGLSTLRYRGYSSNFAHFDMRLKFKGFSLQIYGTMPLTAPAFTDNKPFPLR